MTMDGFNPLLAPIPVQWYAIFYGAGMFILAPIHKRLFFRFSGMLFFMEPVCLFSRQFINDCFSGSVVSYFLWSWYVYSRANS
jgi:hypothetical protein